ncbi:flavin reductase family protein [Nocardia sp. NBC_00565]|uniref:flavin reductase family protein n=1 Tax=Nocardia sp. NBC_00565 TaxID=2975993 RepID=UPI002E814ED1|nr:flavin reductase family protein [Nocardia sp. NBC_00565]WUC04169.1 flavin reductase family protein [Nocardia sp. NBC_00565]
MTILDPTRTIERSRFRHVLGHFPTGVTAITSLDDNGKPVGMAVGSFTSVSLDPPLVAFLPDRSSTTFPIVRANGRFCVNVLSSRQHAVCRALSRKGPDKFSEISWSPTATGLPRITDALAWIDCEIDAVHEAGDHYIAIGRVDALELDAIEDPLIFFQGGYRAFGPADALG